MPKGRPSISRPITVTHTPLHWAAVRGSKGVAELLIRDGSDVNARDAYGNTPLSWARLTGHKEIAELLQSSGA
ncbi:MAG: ankyrin repeat domain-containing protein [Acidiferrobacterales bacterium]